jgi:prephenate dehydrogenase
MPEPGDWRVLLTERAILDAMGRFDEKVARAEALLEADGDEGVIEALRRRGALRTEWCGE